MAISGHSINEDATDGNQEKVNNIRNFFPSKGYWRNGHLDRYPSIAKPDLEAKRETPQINFNQMITFTGKRHILVCAFISIDINEQRESIPKVVQQFALSKPLQHNALRASCELLHRHAGRSGRTSASAASDGLFAEVRH